MSAHCDGFITPSVSSYKSYNQAWDHSRNEVIDFQIDLRWAFLLLDDFSSNVVLCKIPSNILDWWEQAYGYKLKKNRGLCEPFTWETSPWRQNLNVNSSCTPAKGGNTFLESINMSKVSPECQTKSCSSGKVLSLRGASVKFINYRKNLVDLTSLAVSYLKQYTQKDLCTYTIRCFIISIYNRFGSTSSQPTLTWPLTTFSNPWRPLAIKHCINIIA